MELREITNDLNKQSTINAASTFRSRLKYTMAYCGIQELSTQKNFK